MFGKKIVDAGMARKLSEYESGIKTLREQSHALSLEVEKVKLEKKNEMEETKHLVKLRDEKREIEFKKKEMDLEAEKAKAIAEVKDTYRDKMEAQLKTETENIKVMYGQVLERLPNIKVGLKGQV